MHDGKDQFEWAQLAVEGDPASRLEAIEALCEILKTRKPQTSVRGVAFQALVASKAIEAVPFLLTLLNDDDEQLRRQAQNALLEIDPSTLTP